MKRHSYVLVAILAFGALSATQVFGQGWQEPPAIQLTYNAGSSHRVEQITADCDWPVWDATQLPDGSKVKNPDPVCVPTLSQTVTRADVLGQDTAYSFEHEGEVIFLFGDTIGATTGDGNGVDFSAWTTVQNDFDYQAGDTMAWSTTQRSEDGLLLNYFLANGSSPNHALLVQPVYPTSQCYPDKTCGTSLPMGADDIPNSGISLDGQIYIVASSGTTTVTVTNSDGSTSAMHDHSTDYSVLTKFDPAAQTFAAGRTISQASAGGHFVYLAMQNFPPFRMCRRPGGTTWSPSSE